MLLLNLGYLYLRIIIYISFVISLCVNVMSFVNALVNPYLVNSRGENKIKFP